MALIDLTRELANDHQQEFRADARIVKLQSAGTEYTALVYDFRIHSMAGTYLDLPGHIVETDDGEDAGSIPLEKLYRLRAPVIRLDRETGSGGVTAAELREALPAPLDPGDALIINALGEKRFDGIEERSVFLSRDAVAWLIEKRIGMLVSDIYESRQLHGVFYDLFGAGISTVCCPVNLHSLPPGPVRLTVLPLRAAGVTQIPCRLVAEVVDEACAPAAGCAARRR